MPRRAFIRLVRLLAVASACLVPVGVAHADPPANDVVAAPAPPLAWTSLSVTQDVVVQAADWGDATTGLEDGDPPSCTGAIGFRSMWYSVPVPEAAVLRVSVISTETARYQPVVTILDAKSDEVACGVAAIGKPGATATATAYVTPTIDPTGVVAPQTYLVRVAQVSNNTPSGGLPIVTVRFAGRDVTAPHIRVDSPEKVQPRVRVPYSADSTSDGASQVDPSSAHWTFREKINGRTVDTDRPGMHVFYTWRTTGPHAVSFDVKDFAGNESMYRFFTLVRDTVRPSVSFFVQPPVPGARTLRVIVKASESVRLRLLVMEAGRARPLLQKYVTFWGDKQHKRSIPLGRGVRSGVVVVGGIARDMSGNAVALPQCVVDPVTGQGKCITP
jgi:hypothetical protein